MIAGQKVALGRQHAGRTVTVHVSETTHAIDLTDENGDACTRVTRRTTEQPIGQSDDVLRRMMCDT